MRSLKSPKWVILGACAAVGLITSASSAASLNGSLLTPPFPADIAYPSFSDFTLVDLTTTGSLDWIQVGQAAGTSSGSQTGFIQKLTGTSITNYSQSGSVIADVGGGNHFDTFADGSGPTVAPSPQSFQLRTSGINDGFSFDVAASNLQTEELQVFVSAYGGATGTFTAQLLDSSNNLIGLYSADLIAANGLTPGVYRLDFQGDNVGDHLAVSFLQTAGHYTGDQIAFAFATLSPVPEPASLALLFGSAGAMLARRRRSI